MFDESYRGPPLTQHAGLRHHRFNTLLHQFKPEPELHIPMQPESAVCALWSEQKHLKITEVDFNSFFFGFSRQAFSVLWNLSWN